MTATPPFLTRVRIKNYKSIKACDVELGSLAFLVGPNGSGKSNFLDALRFVADILNTDIHSALRTRGGTWGVLRQGAEQGAGFPEVRVDFQTPGGMNGHYSLHILTARDGGYGILQEECSVSTPGESEATWFRVVGGAPETSLDVPLPPLDPQRPYLFSLGGVQPFRTIYEGLVRMSFYGFNLEAIRAPQVPDPAPLRLQRDGSNLASLLAQLEDQSPATLERIEEYLNCIVPAISKVRRQPLGDFAALGFHEGTAPYETISFHQEKARFSALNVSDGTLRALALLTALLQDGDEGPTEVSPSLVAIEEPEMALHPAALGALLDALQDAKESIQVLVTSHSPDLLHSREVQTEELLAVSADSGVTVIGKVDEGSRKALGERLFTPGELLRINQLEPEAAAREANSRQLQFFEL